MTKAPFATIPEAIDDIRQGRMVVVVDDEDRENEGDLTIAAEKVTPDAINFMARYGRGLVCLPMTGERLDELRIPLMVRDEQNDAKFGTAFCVPIEAKVGTTTGISAADRARTVLAAIDPRTKPADLARPGHMFPLRAVPGGVLVRAGQTEAAVDLARMAGLYPAGVICEIMDEDGTMARGERLVAFCRAHGLKLVTITDLIAHRMRTERLVRKVAEANLPTRYGAFRIHAYQSLLDQKEHVALVMGQVKPEDHVLVRVHSQCLTGDIFSSSRCDCGDQLHSALEMIAGAGQGVLLYLGQEGRGIGLLHKLRAYELQDHGQDTVEANESLGFKADQRDYGIGAQILAELGLHRIRLLTNNPRKFVGLEGYGLEIVSRVPLEVPASDANRRYLKTKKEKLGHLLRSV
ncbi:MAG TPA: bifunctional 3,4-dihydroxy-2-butanone-4-phosphate synthase/GTP cyclohydrolase II [Vicinamibacteria bacterium]|nr:bifunctional 3,4-dihydroxy-2-butanone-4-phosphate synthase/GTP cyclohydrolase II [Vicinamibacteria bacterium]